MNPAICGVYTKLSTIVGQQQDQILSPLLPFNDVNAFSPPTKDGGLTMPMTREYFYFTAAHLLKLKQENVQIYYTLEQSVEID